MRRAASRASYALSSRAPFARCSKVIRRGRGAAAASCCGKPVTGKCRNRDWNVGFASGKLLREPKPALYAPPLVPAEQEREKKKAKWCRGGEGDVRYQLRRAADGGLETELLGYLTQTDPKSQARCLSCRYRASLLFPSPSLFLSISLPLSAVAIPVFKKAACHNAGSVRSSSYIARTDIKLI